MDIGLLLVYLAMGAAIVIVILRVTGQPLTLRIGNVLNAGIYVGGALLLRAAGVPALVAYLWPVAIVAFVWIVRRRERRIA